MELPFQEVYTAHKDDTIESVSYKVYGDKQFWPYIWKYNVDMYQRGRAKILMLTPRIIFDGMEILIPVLAHITKSTPSQEINAHGYFDSINKNLPSLKSFDESMPHKDTITKKMTVASDSIGLKLDEQLAKGASKIASPAITIDLGGIEHESPPISVDGYTVKAKYKFNRGSITLQNTALLSINGTINPKDKKFTSEAKVDCEKAFGKMLSEIKLSSDAGFTTGEMKIAGFKVSTSKEKPLDIGLPGVSKEIKVSGFGGSEFTCKVKLNAANPLITPFLTSITYKGSATINSETGELDLLGNNSKYKVSLEDTGLELEFTVSKSKRPELEEISPVKNYKKVALVDKNLFAGRGEVLITAMSKLGSSNNSEAGIPLEDLHEVLRKDATINLHILKDSMKSNVPGTLPFTTFLVLSQAFKTQTTYTHSFNDWHMRTAVAIAIAAPVLIIVALATGGLALPAEFTAIAAGIAVL
ncbi:MAG: hypothetical protein V4591_00595 [Bdellovibrionota bacterium]